MTDATDGTNAVQAALDSAHHWVQPTRDDIQHNVELYQLTYDEAARTLDDQAAELNNARTRAVQYLAFVGAATAFLAGTTIDSAGKHFLFYTLAGLATGFAALAVLAVALLLNPWMTPLFRRVEPRVLLERWIEREVPAPSKAEMLRELSLHFEQWRESNEGKLGRIRVLYFCSILFGGVQLVLWASLSWIAG